MNISYKFRIYPNPSQEKKLLGWLKSCRFLYNSALEERISFYKSTGKSRSFVDQANFLPQIKEICREFNSIHSQVLQDVLKRLDKTYQNFFRRIKSGALKSGFPRFQGRDRYDSFTYTQSGFSLNDKNNGRLFLSKIGHVKIIKHREISGKIKTCTIRKTKTGKWFACFSCEVEKQASAKTGNIIGIDLGLNHFITDSNNQTVSYPKFLKKNLDKLAKIQRKYLNNKSENNKKSIAKIYEKVTNCRNDWQHKCANHLIKDNDIIIVENLNIKNMLEKKGFSPMKRNINDASWNQFVQKLNYKAEWAGKMIVHVEPRDTSKKCSRCGNIKEDLTLSDRIYRCDKCENEMDRDYNAALNIKDLGMQQLNLLHAGSMGIHTQPKEKARSLVL